MLRQLTSRAAASPLQLCSALSTSSLVLSCSTRAMATEASRGARRGASNDCDGPRSSTPMMIASSSGRSSSFPSFDASFVPSTSYSLMSSWGSLGAQMRRRVRDIEFFEKRERDCQFFFRRRRPGANLDLFCSLSLSPLIRLNSPGLLDRERNPRRNRPQSSPPRPGTPAPSLLKRRGGRRPSCVLAVASNVSKRPPPRHRGPAPAPLEGRPQKHPHLAEEARALRQARQRDARRGCAGAVLRGAGDQDRRAAAGRHRLRRGQRASKPRQPPRRRRRRRGRRRQLSRRRRRRREGPDPDEALVPREGEDRGEAPLQVAPDGKE